MAVKAFALGKEMAVAYAFGAASTLDSYLVAFAVPSFVLTIFATSFATALVPEIVTRRGDADIADARDFARQAIAFSIVGAFAATLILAVFGRPILAVVGYGFDAERLSLAFHAYLVLLPVCFFGTIGATLGAVANAWKHFALPALAPAVTTAVMLVMIYFFATSWGVYALAAGVSIGFALEVAVLALFLARAGLPWAPAWAGVSRRLRKVIGSTGHLAVGAALMGGATIVDQAMATSLSPGDVAILSYGTRLTAVIVTALGALATVCLPYFSGLVAGGDWRALRQTLRELAGWIVLITTPIVVAVCAMSEWLIHAIFARGLFSSADAAAAAHVQTLFALHMPFYLLTIMGMRVLTALGRNLSIAAISLFFFAVNASANWLFMRWFGVAGIALGTTAAFAFAACTIYLYLLWDEGPLPR